MSTSLPEPGSAAQVDRAARPGARPTRRRRWWRSGDVWWVIGLVVSFGLGVAANIVSVPYAIMRPGPAIDVLGTASVDGRQVPRIEIQGAPTYPTTGSLDFVTIEALGGPGYRVNVIDVFFAWLDPAADVYPVELLFPPQATKEQVAEENRVEMTASQKDATVAAVRALGHQVPEQIVIAKLSEGAPSAGVLSAGDVLVSVGGKPATDLIAVRSAIQATPAGQAVEVVVTRAGQRLTLTPRTGQSSDGRTVLGIILQRDYTLPFPVTIDAGGVGGPSAGLMFALGVYDKLTEGALTGGGVIAGTGTIDASGAVGPIGGIPQKLVAARQGGAAFFLAPAANCAEAAGRIPDGLTVLRVSTFAEAKHAVEQIAAGHGADLPRCVGAP